MSIEDQILDENKSSIDSVVRGGFNTPAYVPSMDFERGMVPNGNKPYSNSISPKRAVEAPISTFQKGASSISSGLRASEASSNGEMYDTTDAAASIGSATIAGAAAGGAVGGPVGAFVAGSAAALTSSVNAWLSLRANKRKRAQLEAIKKEAKEREAKEAALTAEEKAYNRSKEAKAGAADMYFKTVDQLQRLAANDKALQQNFITMGAR